MSPRHGMMVRMIRSWGSAWRVFAALPFVLLCAVLALKVGNARTDPTGAIDDGKSPVPLTQDLGAEAPDSTAKPEKAKPTDALTGLPSDLPTDLLTGVPTTALPTETSASPTGAAKPAPPTRTPSTSPTSSPSSSHTPSPDPTTQEPTPLTPKEQCEADGKHWRQNLLNGQWYCSAL